MMENNRALLDTIVREIFSKMIHLCWDHDDGDPAIGRTNKRMFQVEGQA